ncbi:MAG: PDC sensor domain-containing protein [Eubacterium aggregans]
MALIFISIFASGLLGRLDESAAQVLGRTVQSRRDYLQYDMVNKWREIGDTASQLDTIYANSGQNAARLSSDATAYTDYLRQATPMLISMMRTNAVSGAFVILRGSPIPANPVKDSLTGIYIRDRDPSSVYNSDNKDLLFERVPVDVVTQTGITTDSYWTPKFALSEDNADHRYFYNPYRGALENKDLSDTDLAYWSPAYHLNEEDNVISIAYSVPLIADDGTLYGVLGVEILTDYLIEQLSTEEITDNGSAYCLAVQQKPDGPYQAVAVNSSNYQLTQDTLKEFNLQLIRYKKCSLLTGLQNTSQMVAATGKLSLYNRNAPFLTNNGFSWPLSQRPPYPAFPVIRALP